MQRMWIGLAFVTLAACGGGSEGDPDAGATVYTASCAPCHGADGTGATEGAADLTAVVAGLDDGTIEDTILNGSGDMAAVALDDTELADVIAYLRQEFGGGAE